MLKMWTTRFLYVLVVVFLTITPAFAVIPIIALLIGKLSPNSFLKRRIDLGWFFKR